MQTRLHRIRQIPRWVCCVVLGGTLLLGLAACGSGATAKHGHKIKHQSLALAGTKKSKAGRARPSHVVSRSYIRAYAAAVLPGLDHSVPLFDAASTQASSQTDSGSCGTSGDDVQILAGEVDGVPHAVPWYYAVGQLHHRMMGVFHLLLGAIQACDTAASNGDSYGVSTAIGDMRTAAADMRQLDGEVRGLTRA